MRHQRSMRVKFGHSDPARIVYYPRFFEWFHDIFEELFEVASGVPYATILNERRVGFPAVQVAAEYRAPARFGDEVELEVFLSRLSMRSGTFEYRVRGSAGLLTLASVKVASMDLDRQRSIEFPEDLRAALAPYLDPDGERPDPSRIWG